MPISKTAKSIIAGVTITIIGFGSYMGFRAYQENWLAASQDVESSQYTVEPADELFLLSVERLAAAKTLIRVVGGARGEHLAIRFGDQSSVLLYPAISHNIFADYYERSFKKFLEDNPGFDYRVVSSLKGIGEKLGATSDPTAEIARDALASAWNVVVGFLKFLVLVLIFIFVMIAIQGHALTNQVDRVDHDDIDDSIDDLVGMADIKQELMQLKDMIDNKEIYSEYGVNKPFNVMLTGPAGVGKTKMARCLAKLLKVPLYYASAASLQSGYVGGGPRTLSKLYKRASKEKRAIIFLDEAETILEDRNQRNREKYENEASTTLLSLLDGVNSNKENGVIWIVASNFDQHRKPMDEAMLRRFHLKINFRMPNLAERTEIIRRLLTKRSPEKVDQDMKLDYVASITSGMSPASLESLVSRASLIAIQEKTKITDDLMFRAYERVSVGLTDRASTEEMEQKRRVIAIHECGHFIAQLHHTMLHNLGDISRLHKDLNVLKISTESLSNIGALGYVLSRIDDVPLESRREFEERICELYGGMANEEFILGEQAVTAGAKNDIEVVSNLLSMMFSEIGYYSNSKLNFKTLQRAGFDVGQQRFHEITQRAEALYEYTLRVMERYQDLTRIMTNTLMDMYVMTLSDILPVVERFYADNPEILLQYECTGKGTLESTMPVR